MTIFFFYPIFGEEILKRLSHSKVMIHREEYDKSEYTIKKSYIVDSELIGYDDANKICYGGCDDHEKIEPASFFDQFLGEGFILKEIYVSHRNIQDKVFIKNTIHIPSMIPSCFFCLRAQDL